MDSWDDPLAQDVCMFIESVYKCQCQWVSWSLQWRVDHSVSQNGHKDNACVAVPGKNRILFHCIFQAHHRVWCAIARWTSAKGGAHTHYVNAWISDPSTKRIWAPPLGKRSATSRQTQWCARNTRRNNIRFLSGTATCVVVLGRNWTLFRCVFLFH